MSIHLSIDLSTFLVDVGRTLSHDHPGQPAEHDRRDPVCPICALIARAQHLVTALRSDPDAPLFTALEAAGAADVVSSTVDHLEATLLLITPCLKVDPRALLRAVIVTAQQRLDWGYGPIGGVHDGATAAQPDRGSDVPDQPQRPHRATSRGRRRSTRKSSPLGRSNPAA